MLQLIKEPTITAQQDKPYIGIRFKAPYSNMYSCVELQFKQLRHYLKNSKETNPGPFFLRYYVVNMRGEMELEIGVMGTCDIQESMGIESGIIPAGSYATLTYKGLGLAANKHLLNWIDQNNYTIQKESHNYGDVFACRYEAYLTNAKIEPSKKQWDIELSIKINTRT